MKFTTTVLTLGLAALISLPAQARNTQVILPIKDAMAASRVQEKLGGPVQYFFGSQSTPKILQNISIISVSRKTNASNKSDVTACNWAFLSAMLALKKSAMKEGANAVVHIVSDYNHQPVQDPNMFECHAGTFSAGVVLKGDLVRIEG